MNPAGECSVVEVINAYRKFAQSYYCKNGQVTREFGCIKEALSLVRQLYGRTLANDFGPLALKAVRQKMIERGWSRSYINKAIGRVRRCFKWAVENELVSPGNVQALTAVARLRKGRTEAKELPPIVPVSESAVDATIPHLNPVVADMVRLQRLAGMRPTDVCNLRPCDVDRSGSVWVFRPESHKTEHHDRERVIFIGPKGQDELRPYLLRPAEAHCFSPAEGEAKRRASRHEQRRTPLSCGNRPGTNRSAAPKRAARDHYDTNSYRRAIHRAHRPSH